MPYGNGGGKYADVDGSGKRMLSQRAPTGASIRPEKSAADSKQFSNQWCTPSFDRPPGNAGWGAMPPVASPSGDHNGNWKSNPGQPPVCSGWGPSATWSPHGNPNWESTAGTYPTRPYSGNVYLPDNPGWGPPNPPPSTMAGWDSSVMQPGHGNGEWGNAPPSYGANAPQPYGVKVPPPSHHPSSFVDGGWPTETSFRMPHQPAATPVASQHHSRFPEPAIGVGPPSMPASSGYHVPQPRVQPTTIPDSAAGDVSQKPPPPSAARRLTTDTKVVCAPLSRLAALPVDDGRWVVLLAQLERPPVGGAPRRQFVVREPDGTRTECVYYELERPLPALQAGKWVRCVGRPDARGLFVCVTARPAARQDIGLHRQLQQLALTPAATAG